MQKAIEVSSIYKSVSALKIREWYIKCPSSGPSHKNNCLVAIILLLSLFLVIGYKVNMPAHRLWVS